MPPSPPTLPPPPSAPPLPPSPGTELIGEENHRVMDGQAARAVLARLQEQIAAAGSDLELTLSWRLVRRRKPA